MLNGREIFEELTKLANGKGEPYYSKNYTISNGKPLEYYFMSIFETGSRTTERDFATPEQAIEHYKLLFRKF